MLCRGGRDVSNKSGLGNCVLFFISSFFLSRSALLSIINGDPHFFLIFSHLMPLFCSACYAKKMQKCERKPIILSLSLKKK